MFLERIIEWGWDDAPLRVPIFAGEIPKRVLRGKGNKARTAWLDPDATAHIARWLDARRKLGLRNGLLLCGLHGQPWSPQAAREVLYRAARKAGLEKRVHPHGLRHSHAAELALEGVPTRVIQQQLGHANLAVTDRYLRGITSADVGAYIRQRQWKGSEP